MGSPSFGEMSMSCGTRIYLGWRRLVPARVCVVILCSLGLLSPPTFGQTQPRAASSADVLFGDNFEGLGIDAIADQAVRVGASLNLALNATDPDVADTLSFARLAGPATLVVGAAGALSFTPTSADVGRVLVRVGVADAAGESDVTQFYVTVERANQ